MTIIFGLAILSIIVCCYHIIRLIICHNNDMKWICLLSDRNERLINEGRYDEVKADGYGYDLLPHPNEYLKKFWIWKFDNFLSTEAKERIYG